MPFGSLNLSAPFQPLKSSKKSFFSHFLSLFFAQLLSKLGQELEIKYVHLVGALDVLWWGAGISTFQPNFIPQQPQRSEVLVVFSYILSLFLA